MKFGGKGSYCIGKINEQKFERSRVASWSVNGLCSRDKDVRFMTANDISV